MRIAYVLASPDLAGGTKVVFQHARLLEEAGEEVRILGAGPRPRWHSPAEYHDFTQGLSRLPSQDLLIATYWTTLPVARELGLGPVAHFCQGYEGSFAHLLAERPAIERVYREPAPTLTVTPHLAALLAARFGRECRVAPPVLDRLFRPRPLRSPRSPRRRPWIALPGIFEAEVKGVPTALAAVAELERRGLAVRLLRFSTHTISDDERAVRRADRELVGVLPRTVARALRGCDLLLFPSRPEEGFGLPLLEAMASGVPAVSSRIPSAEFLAGGAVALVDPEEPRDFADAAEAVLRDGARWQAARRAGIEAAERFSPERIAPQLHDAVRWAAAVAENPARSAS